MLLVRILPFGACGTGYVDRTPRLQEGANVLERAFRVPHRTGAMAIGVDKVQKAKLTRGLFP